VWKGASYDCQQCGACCTNQESAPATGYVCLSNDESKQMKRLGLSVVQTGRRFFLGTRARVESDHPVCVALHGRVGGSCGCTIYEQRPYNCRKFEVGSGLCEAARASGGLPI
jgi:Fe-S-cluster containining protein